MRRAVFGVALLGAAILGVAATGVLAPELAAQTASPTGSPTATRLVGPVAGVGAQAAIDRARTLVESGQSGDARLLLDSLVAGSAAQPGDLADALYWRAVLGERAADAERDWKRLILDVPLSPRVPTALLRLGELEMVRGHPAVARTYLERLARDYNEASERPKALLWVVRSYFEERDVPRACTALTTLRRGGLPDGEIRLQTSELQARCARESKAQATTATPTGRYSVQIAAYNTRREAEATAERFVARGMEARVDGEVKPFRVRIGRYATMAQAEAALADLKKKGQNGFVAVLTP